MGAAGRPTPVARRRDRRNAPAADCLPGGPNRDRADIVATRVVRSGRRCGTVRRRIGRHLEPLGPSHPSRNGEREILEYLRRGLAKKEIAASLGISVKTVKSHLTSLFQKIGVMDRTQAALWAERFATDRPVISPN